MQSEQAMCEPCLAAWGEIGSGCAERHTDAVIGIATIFAGYFGHSTPSLEQVGWYMDDAEVVLGVCGLQDSWQIEQAGVGRSSVGAVPLIEINGRVFQLADEGPLSLYDASFWEETDDAE